MTHIIKSFVLGLIKGHPHKQMVSAHIISLVAIYHPDSTEEEPFQWGHYFRSSSSTHEMNHISLIADTQIPSLSLINRISFLRILPIPHYPL